MNKSERYSFIQNLAKKKLIIPVVEATKSEIKEEINLALIANDDQNIIESEYNQRPSVEILKQTEEADKIEKILNRNKTDEYLLSNSEKRQIAIDLAIYRRKFWLVPANFFSNVLTSASV